MTKSHIDAMDHMLNDIFRKVFWEPLKHKEVEDMFCKECDGDGYIERVVHRPMSFDRDVGVIDVDQIDCPECLGSGQNLNEIT